MFDRGKEMESKKDSVSGRVNEPTFKIDINKSHFIDYEGFFCSAYIEEVEHRVSETPWWLINLVKPLIDCSYRDFLSPVEKIFLPFILNLSRYVLPHSNYILNIIC